MVERLAIARLGNRGDGIADTAAGDRRREGGFDRPAQSGDEGRDVGADGGVDRGIAHDALLEMAALADLELRLDQRDELRARGRERERRGQHRLERDEAHVDGDNLWHRVEPGGIERPNVRLLQRHHLGPAAQARMQLVAADVDREDAARAAREQDLGEAAGRGADIEADATRDVDRQPVERMGELDPAARDPGKGGLGRERGIDRDRLGGFAHGRAVGGDVAGRDGGLRLGAAVEQAARHQQKVGPLAGAHAA